MTLKKFEEFLAESFGKGSLCRELRLSDEEVAYVKEKYPGVVIEKCEGLDSSDGRFWYVVTLPVYPFHLQMINAEELDVIQQENERMKHQLTLTLEENERLKQELDRLKSNSYR